MCVVKSGTSYVVAKVESVLPELGLAYLLGEDDREWSVTKSTPGIGLELLAPGQQLRLTVDRYKTFALVCEYGALS